MSFRIEEKIPVSLLEGSQLIADLRTQGLTTLFPTRIITSDYFDNYQYDLYRDSEEGLLPRKKVRIRYYPDSNDDKFLLEKKILVKVIFFFCAIILVLVIFIFYFTILE